MAHYNPPVSEMRFLLEELIGLEDLAEHPDLGKIDGEIVESILEPAAKLASEMLAPLNWDGDQNGATLKEGAVTTSPGFKEAYQAYCEGGWNAVPFPQHYGGQNLPWVLAFAVQEMWQGANMSFGLCPLLNQGAVDAILHHGSDEQKDYYLPKLISGEWTGTMNLTEPQAGSDLSAIRTKAEKQTDGTYKITGQKIYITYGEHDFTKNIIHLVLARLPDAPEGVKGISLFIVPKFLEDGARNDVICTGLEHKLGIHASPTCTMQFGDKGGAIGYLIGQKNEGLKYMFTMMNNARLSVGLQGVGIAEHAYQHALAYANDRSQGYDLEEKSSKINIVQHPDVSRMLTEMRVMIAASRAITYQSAYYLDLAGQEDEKAKAFVELYTPIVKTWCTDMAQHVTSLGIQIHGGMGFVEETGAAQFYRDARILPIYEGTNGIQANDFVFRKILRDEGRSAFALLEELKEVNKEDVKILKQGVNFVLQKNKNLKKIASVAYPLLQGFAVILCQNMLNRSAKLSNANENLALYFEKAITPQYLTRLKDLEGLSEAVMKGDFKG